MKKNTQIKNKLISIFSTIESKAKKKPFVSLFIILGLLLITIAFSNYLKKPAAVEESTSEPKVVSIYSIGEAPRIEVSANVQQTQVITIVSLVGGIVKNISVEVGQSVNTGQTIASLSTDYYGNNASWIQKQLAQTQYDNVLDTYENQKEIISKQKDLANLQADNANELRQIANDSIDETKQLLELNESILSGIDLAITNATNSTEVSQLNAQKSQLLAGINQIRSGLRQAKYQGSDNTPLSQLAELTKEMTFEQISIQEKALEMSVTISELQLKLAKIQAATMFPGSPVSGTIERIFVKRNQMVSPGTPIATIKANTGATQLIAKVSKQTANKVSLSEASKIYINDQIIDIYPDYVSSVATDGSLFTITYTLANEYSNSLTNNGQVVISIPLGSADTTSVSTYLPLESIHQSELESTIFVLNDNTVISKTVELGSIDGRFVNITNGLNTGDMVILNRDVIEGEKVTIK